MKQNNRSYVAILSAALAVIAVSCLSVQDAKREPASSGPKIVEAYLEYSSPGEKWLAPVPTLIHIDARSAPDAKVQVTPDVGPFARQKQTELAPVDNRKPAAVQPKVAVDLARIELASLAQNLGHGAVASAPCMYPIHARFVDSGGKIAEYSGCRGDSDFSKSFSQAVHYWIEAGN